MMKKRIPACCGILCCAKTKRAILCSVLCINGEDIPHRSHLIMLFEFVLPQVKSIMLSINKQRTNVIMGEKSICIYGRDHIFETLCGLDFKISAESFFAG